MVCVARQVVSKLNTEHNVLVETMSSGFLTTDPKISRSCRLCTLAAQSIMDVPCGRPIYILASSVSNREVYLPKNMKIANTANPPSIIHAVDTVDQSMAPVETPEADVSFIASKAGNASKVTRNHPHRDDVSAAHYEPSEGRKTKISAHTAVQKYDCNQQAHNCQDEF